MTKSEALQSMAPAVVRRGAICVFIWTFLAATAAHAQRKGASVDVGGLTMRYADTVNANAAAITPAFWRESRATSFRLSSTLSQFTSGNWSAQGEADASVFTRRAGSLIGEIEGATGGSAHEDGSRTGQLLAIARAHLFTPARGAWLGAGLGGTWDGSAWRNVRQGEVAGWTRFGAVTAFGSVSPVAVNDSIRYTDAQLSAGLSLTRVELNASAGFRGGNDLPQFGGTAKSWGSARVTGWIGSRVAVVASAGTYPVDFTQGFPGGRFASLSVRLGSRRFPAASSSVSEVSDISVYGPGSRGSSSRAGFIVRPLGSDRYELRVLAQSAKSVEIMGDFTGWQPVPLLQNGEGWWTVALPLSKGIHELNMRIDGGGWAVPAGLPHRSDEFGGTVGVLVIP